MKKTIRIHITGYIFNIEEDAFDVLEAWLKKISGQYGTEDGGDEIVNDIETRVAELFQTEIKEENGVISLKEVNKVIEIMGNPEDFEQHETRNEEGSNEQDRDMKGFKIYKRLYRDEERKVIGGVCAGLAHYTGIDISLIRVVFIVSVLIGGFGAILYLILWIFIPPAETSSQKLEMQGEPVTISNIEKLIKNEFENVKQTIKDKKYSENLKNFQTELGGILQKIGKVIVALFKGLSGVVGVALLVVGIVSIILLFGLLFHHSGWETVLIGSEISHWDSFVSIIPLPFSSLLATIGIFLLIAVPLAGITFAGIRVLFRLNGSRGKAFRVTSSILWIFGFLITSYVAFYFFRNFNSENTTTKTHILESHVGDLLHLRINNTYIKKFDDPLFQIANYHILKSGKTYELYGRPEMNISGSRDTLTKLKLTYSANGDSEQDAGLYMNQIHYRWSREDSVILCDPYFTVSGDNKLYMRDLVINLEIPEGRYLIIDSTLNEMINEVELSEDLRPSGLYGKKLLMTEHGLSIAGDSISSKKE